MLFHNLDIEDEDLSFIVSEILNIREAESDEIVAKHLIPLKEERRQELDSLDDEDDDDYSGRY